MRRSTIVFWLGLALGPHTRAHTVVEIAPVHDNSLYSDRFSESSNGAGEYLFSGRIGGESRRRALVAFDVAGAIPTGSMIHSVTLTLHVSLPFVLEESAYPFSLHRVTASWGEAGSDAGEPGGTGAPAETGDATWMHRFWPDTHWETPGGTFLGSSSAAALVPATLDGAATWETTPGLVADVQGWLDDPASNRGWILIGDERQPFTARRFGSRENATPGHRPRLIVEYMAPAAAGACCQEGATCVQLAPADCASGNGIYHGDGSTCEPDPCRATTGACCAHDGACIESPAAACESAGGRYEGDGTTCLASSCGPVLEPFVDPLPRLPTARPAGRTAASPASYSIAMRELQHRFHRDLPLTTVWGYGDGPVGASVPGPTIEAIRDRPIEVTWINDLRDESGALRTEHYFPVDHCPHGAHDPSPRTVVHLHGGHVPAEYDGYPEDTLLPGEQETYKYPNAQLPATLWYHDHALGITRLNLYMGLAGFYLIRDTREQSLGLPRGKFEVPMMIQDRSFRSDGSLVYPEQWQDHFLGNTITVNGKVWPYMQVRKGLYRFRILNASNSRIYSLGLSRADLRFTQIGSDGGLLPEPVVVDRIRLAPAERADAILDFSALAPGSEVIVTNDDASHGVHGSGGTIAEVMKFVVVEGEGHSLPLPAKLIPIERLREADAVLSRQFELRLGPDACTGSAWLINGLHWDDITEFPELGTQEVWSYVNRSGMTHPMHPHLVQGQLLDRQPFQVVGGAIVPTGPRLAPSPEEAGWKDTFQVPPFHIARIVVRFENFTGLYAHHCHILEHEDHEMMRQYRTVDCGNGVVEPGEQCDDGNLAGSDGCSASCDLERPIPAGRAQRAGGRERLSLP